MHHVFSTDTHDIADPVNYGIVKNTIEHLENGTLLQRNKNILNLCFRWHFLRGYRFVMEVIFNEKREGKQVDQKEKH